MKRISGLFFSLLLLFACNDDDEKLITANVYGTWKGMNSTFKVNPDGIIPAFTIGDQKLLITLDFEESGKLTLTDNKQVVHQGSFSRSNEKITISMDYAFELIELSGEYLIEELTDTTFRISTKREGTYTHPDTGQQFNGKVEATFSFEKEVSLK